MNSGVIKHNASLDIRIMHSKMVGQQLTSKQAGAIDPSVEHYVDEVLKGRDLYRSNIQCMLRYSSVKPTNIHQVPSILNYDI